MLLRDPLWFDVSRVPAGQLRFLRTMGAVGAILFGTLAIYGFMTMSRLLDAPAKDIQAVLILMKVAFLFVVSGVVAAVAVVLAILAVRCWIALARG